MGLGAWEAVPIKILKKITRKSVQQEMSRGAWEAFPIKILNKTVGKSMGNGLGRVGGISY